MQPVRLFLQYAVLWLRISIEFGWVGNHWMGRVVWYYFLCVLCWVGCAVTGAFACLD